MFLERPVTRLCRDNVVVVDKTATAKIDLFGSDPADQIFSKFSEPPAGDFEELPKSWQRLTLHRIPDEQKVTAAAGCIGAPCHDQRPKDLGRAAPIAVGRSDVLSRIVPGQRFDDQARVRSGGGLL
ncbi:hypothetical protein [Candidatus Laterigemmans baculatus]|uniref:hypothetical protein n=1 Tax=Candidatus Laterigemmans baculatus TaxID=2770505 RepID=UPI0013D93D61|nr:hypothetical protein [Candidatus Laterigemmans baculatus]